MIKLEAHDLQWVRGFEDDPSDLCAHGRVLLEIAGARFVSPEDGIWTLSAAGLYLLRSLRQDHVASSNVTEGNLLFPCCGFFLIPTSGGRFPLVIQGCPNGVDLEISHSNGLVLVRSPMALADVPSVAWRSAILAFASSVRDFYRSAAPKAPIEDQREREGWALFWQEWDERSAGTEL